MIRQIYARAHKRPFAAKNRDRARELQWKSRSRDSRPKILFSSMLYSEQSLREYTKARQCF
jgi:hypothetical protein